MSNFEGQLPTLVISHHVSAVAWSPVTRVLFRFFGLFFVLSNLGWVFSVAGLGNAYNNALAKPVVWTARNILDIQRDFPIQFNGSGDRTYDYTLFFLFGILSLIGTVVWSMADSRRPHYRRLHEWLRVFLRYVLGLTMLGYGFAKVFWMQMQFPSLNRLLQPHGDSSPMGLAWTYMGYSEAYSIFAGGLEVLGGFLLFWRRTTLLGALILLGVVINIVAVNFCFDVPVKLYSVQLTLTTLFLLAPDIQRLWNGVVMRKSVPAQVFVPHFRDQRINKVLFWLKHVVLAAYLVYALKGSLEARQQYGPGYQRSALYGIWEVEMFVRNGDTIPALLDDQVRWRRMVADRDGVIYVYRMDDTRNTYQSVIDTTAHTLRLNTYQDTATRYQLDYARPTKDRLTLRGVWQADTLFVAFRQFDLTNFELVSRGFNWVNEYPHNR
ncbi:MAG: hypothetical protein R3301_07995 [Saprospiraceae bacterium]|nr:hypothetical protein [Saprospiraceae bacterium]